MRKLILATTLLAIFTVSAFASGDDTPAAVKTKFASLYPKVTKVKWGKEDANYEAEFEVNKTEMSCLFDASGTLLETETKIAVTALPKAATEYCTKTFSGSKISEASKIVDSKQVVTYEAEVKGVGDVIFDEKGNFIKKVVEQKEKQDKKK